MALVGAAAVGAAWLGSGTKQPSEGPDRADPVAVATAFAQRYAANDSAACWLTNQRLGAVLQQDGRCAGTKDGALEPVTVLHEQTCGDRHGQSMQIQPVDGREAPPYLTVSLRRTNEQWSVVAVLPVHQRDVIRPYECAESSR